MKKYSFFFSILFFFSIVSAQTPYTQNQFAYDSLMNVVYGTAINYAGNTDTLKMDIYKPIADSNCLRPIIIMVHGGAWIGGTKADANMVYMSRQLAKKGWVVANINYRLGTHKAANYSMYALCNTSISQPCGYICDSAEVYRANYRAMQDAKGAIRFMKNRNQIDSTDVNNVFIAGESAGGFIALATAFTDKLSEKHASCYSISNAPTPDSDLNTYGCIPTLNNLSRPDLGSIDGTLHIGSYDALVKGVGNFYGAVFDLNIFQQASDTPCVYMFHQGSDVVVHYNYGTVLGRTSWECYAQTNICQQYYFYPKAYGSEGVRQHLVTLGATAPVYQADIVANYSYLNNCFSNGHSIDNSQVRLQNMVNVFATKIAASGNNPQTNCINNSISFQNASPEFVLFPNPSKEMLYVKADKSVKNEGYKIYNLLGTLVKEGRFSNNSFSVNIQSLSDGAYFFFINNSSQLFIKNSH